jgi:hypothetical protein
VTSSHLLPGIFEKLAEREKIVVLDAGAGSQSTIDFLSGYNAKLVFVDLLAMPWVADPPEEFSGRDAAVMFIDHLGLESDITFDLCLLWDTMQYMDLGLVHALSLALSAHVDERTLAYAFGSLYAKFTEDPGHHGFGLVDEGHLKITPVERNLTNYHHSQQQIDEYFGCLSVQRATLLKKGRLELLLAMG